MQAVRQKDHIELLRRRLVQVDEGFGVVSLDFSQL
jgi:hypothetical protein